MQILGPTTYAFSTVVAIFIIGIAGGAAIGSRLAARMKNPAIGLAVLDADQRRPRAGRGVGASTGRC